MTKTILPQRTCYAQVDHKAHGPWHDPAEQTYSGATTWYHCPGRYTPSRYHAPHVSPEPPADPFANCDD